MDPRIAHLCKMAQALRRGEWQVTPPPGPDDGLAELAQELASVGQMLGQRERGTRALLHVLDEINSGLKIDEILNDVFESFGDLIPYDRIGYAVLEGEDGVSAGVEARQVWARTRASEQRVSAGFHCPLAGSSLQGIIETRRPRILNDLEQHLREHPDSYSTRMILSEGMRSNFTWPLAGPEGKPVGFLFFSSMQADTYRNAHVEIFEQIAGQLSAALEKARLYERLFELNEARAQFLRIASHDLKTPLTNIKTMAWLLEKNVPPGTAMTEKTFDLVRRMARQANVMQRIVEDFLDFQAFEDGSIRLARADVQLDEIARNVVEANGDYAQKKEIALELLAGGGLPVVSADAARIEQAMQNLVGNALKFSPSGSRVEVRVSRDDDGMLFEVADSGPGLSDEDKAHAFRKYSRLSNAATGGEKSSGLGLAISKQLIELHGGQIGVAGNPGGGARFWFRLPAGTDTLEAGQHDEGTGNVEGEKDRA
jgi:signal transduction histidine kinase